MQHSTPISNPSPQRDSRRLMEEKAAPNAQLADPFNLDEDPAFDDLEEKDDLPAAQAISVAEPDDLEAYIPLEDVDPTLWAAEEKICEIGELLKLPFYEMQSLFESWFVAFKHQLRRLRNTLERALALETDVDGSGNTIEANGIPMHRLRVLENTAAQIHAAYQDKKQTAERASAERNCPFYYWRWYRDIESQLLTSLQEDKEPTPQSRLQYWISSMTFYLSSSISAALCHQPSLVFEKDMQANWLAASLCLHVCRRELGIPWHPEDFIGRVIQQIEGPALRILEALDPNFAAFVGGKALEDDLESFGQGLHQASHAFVQSLGHKTLFSIVFNGLQGEMQALGNILSPYFDSFRYPRYLDILRNTVTWHRHQRNNLHKVMREEEKAIALAKLTRQEPAHHLLGAELADLIEAQIQKDPDFIPDPDDRARWLAECTRMRAVINARTSVWQDDDELPPELARQFEQILAGEFVETEPMYIAPGSSA